MIIYTSALWWPKTFLEIFSQIFICIKLPINVIFALIGKKPHNIQIQTIRYNLEYNHDYQHFFLHSVGKLNTNLSFSLKNIHVKQLRIYIEILAQKIDLRDFSLDSLAKKLRYSHFLHPNCD